MACPAGSCAAGCHHGPHHCSQVEDGERLAIERCPWKSLMQLLPSVTIRQRKLRIGGLIRHQFCTDSGSHHSFLLAGTACRDFPVLFISCPVHVEAPHGLSSHPRHHLPNPGEQSPLCKHASESLSLLVGQSAAEDLSILDFCFRLCMGDLCLPLSTWREEALRM